MERSFFQVSGRSAQMRGQAAGTAAGQRPRGQWNIGVTGLGRSVGTTFVASTLAFFVQSMGRSVTFCQCLDPQPGQPLLYDAVAMEQRFASRRFTDVYARIAEDLPVRMPCNLECGVCWLLPTPAVREQALCWETTQRARLVGCARGEVCIFDFAADPVWDPFLLQMDALLILADPLPSRLIAGEARFRALKQMELAGTQCLWVCNRDNSGVSHRQVTGFLKTRSVLWLPGLDPALLYADEYACRFHWENPEIRRHLLEIFTKTSRELGLCTDFPI